MKIVGICMTESKISRMSMLNFCEKHKSDDLKFTIVDTTTNLEPQGPFHAFIHKFDLSLDESCISNKLTNQWRRIKAYIRGHPEMIIMDCIHSLVNLTDRLPQNILTAKVVQHPDLVQSVFSPAFCNFDSLDVEFNFQKLVKRGLTFPIVCKPKLAHNGQASHAMCIVFHKDGLADIKPPCVAQTFVNHNARLFKIFNVGKHTMFTERPSLKNFDVGNKPTVHFTTFEVSKEDSHCSLNKLDAGDPIDNLPEPDFKLFCDIGRVYRELSNIDFLGIDVISCRKTSKFAIIDVNYFPGYERMADFHRYMEELVREKLDLPVIKDGLSS